jgi:hypothetical protein
VGAARLVSDSHGPPLQGPPRAGHARRPRLLARPPRPSPLPPRPSPPLLRRPAAPSRRPPRRAPFPVFFSIFRLRLPLFPCRVISHLPLPISRLFPSPFNPRFTSFHTPQARLETSSTAPPPRARNPTKTAHPNEASFETSPDQHSPQIKDESLRPSPYHPSQSGSYRRVGRDGPIWR